MRWPRRRRRKRRTRTPLVWVALYGQTPDGLEDIRLAARHEITDDKRAFDWGPAVESGRIDGVAVFEPRSGESRRIPFDAPVNIGKEDTVTVTLGPIRFPAA